MIENHISLAHSYACATVVGPSVPAGPHPAMRATARVRARRFLAVACQDRQLRVYQVTKARQLFHYRASTSEDGSPVCCAVDPTSTVIATGGIANHFLILSLAFLFLVPIPTIAKVLCSGHIKS